VDKSDVPGKYMMVDGNAMAVEVRADGTFANYKARQNGSGTWQIDEEQFSDGVELDGGSGQDGFADEYRLTERYGALCIEVHKDEEYWCKR
jgi:hypothetical protein